MSKKHILLLFGGASSEHDVSLMSAKNINNALNREGYEVSLGCISRSGEWRLVDGVREPSPEDKKVIINLGDKAFQTEDGAIRADVVFPVLHGKYGEDGTVQGFLEMIDVPYVGCKVEASALCMDKIRAKRLLQQAGIPVVPDVVVDKRNQHEDLTQMVSALNTDTCFVKPSRAGSSIGVSKVTDANKLLEAVQLAFRHDDEVLIEAAVNNPRELEVAVLGNYPNIQVSGVGEIMPGADFYDYDDKYSDDSKSQVNVSADLPAEVEQKIRNMAGRAYSVLKCHGLARIDFLLSADGELFLNEVNTMPGFTNISMYPKLMENAGYSQTELVDKLIQLALE